MSRLLYVVSCGAPLAQRAGDGIREASARGWEVAFIPTRAATEWVDLNDLDDKLVVTDHRDPGTPKRLPPPDAVAVVPMTFNTLNAWATGIANTYPLSVLSAALGTRTPTVAVPFAKHELAGHPAWLASLAVLRYAGVALVDPTTGAVNHPEPVASGTGEQVAEDFQWSWVFDALSVQQATS